MYRSFMHRMYRVERVSTEWMLRNTTLPWHSCPGGGGGPAIFIYGGVRMKGKIQTKKYGFTVNFAPKNIVILHIFYPKIWMTILF